jgi:hypothetical protein
MIAVGSRRSWVERMYGKSEYSLAEAAIEVRQTRRPIAACRRVS